MAIQGRFRVGVVIMLMLLSRNDITSQGSAGVAEEPSRVETTSRLTVAALHRNHSHSRLRETELVRRATSLKWVGSRDHSALETAASENSHEERIASSAASMTMPMPMPMATTIRVDKRRGSGHFTTVQAAIDHVSVHNDRRVHILVAPGVYKEKILVPSSKPYITIVGGGWNNTILEWSDTADSMANNNGEKLGTFWSASVVVEADFFVARNITFKNSAPEPQVGGVGKQAVALRITGDRGAFYTCKFVSGQDTLYDHQGRHYFKDCLIEGSIDFIFGDGQSLYEGCDLHAIPGTTFGSVAAHKRGQALENTGFSFVHCRITGSGLLYLGRAWGSYARVVYSYTFMDNVIPVGWSNWNDPQRNQTVVFGQYKCSGPGANRIGRVPWAHELTDSEARPFLSLSFIDGDDWLKP